MFTIDLEARKAMNESNMHLAARLAAVMHVMMANKLCTLKELETAIAVCETVTDQNLAAARDKANRTTSAND